MKRLLKAARVSVLLFFAGCVSGVPEAIIYGMDLCASCRMQIDDRRFGAVLVTTRGRTAKFDSINCLREYARNSGVRPSSMWVSDFSKPGTMMRADSARFIDIGPGRSPMGRGWIAVASADAARALAATLGIAVVSVKQWNELS